MKTSMFHFVIGNSKDSSSNSSSKSKESKDVEDNKDSDKDKEKDKDRDRKQSVSFPPSNTTDSVRLKSRELLANALRAGKSN